MRRARFLACFLIAMAFPGPISSLFAQDVTSIIHDVSDVADGSIEQARLEAQRQATGAGPAYRSFKKGDTRFFSGKYTPPELSEDKKDRFVYGLAMFSDDGCDVAIKGSRIHQRLGKGQHLPSIGDSFHLLPIVLTPGEPVDITVGYSNTIYVNDPDSPDYPDIDGCTLFLYLIPAAIAVDANRDGTIAFSGEARDVTSANAPFRFWCNDDNDGLPNSEGDDLRASFPDHEDGFIQTARDLEDFARIWVRFDAFQKEISDGDYLIGLKWKNSPEGPSINVYRSTDTNGSDSYLKEDSAALSQISGKDAESIGPVSGVTPLILPNARWSGQNSIRCLLFEGSREGKGQLVLTIQKSDGTPIGEGPSVWLDLKNIKKMYQRVDSATAHPWENVTFEPDPHADQKNAIIFVHGWRMSPKGAGNFAETLYKRLWHRGFKGRFAAFHWDTYWSDEYGWLPYAGQAIDSYLAKYNDSEHNAWLAGNSLAEFLNSLPSSYSKNVAAHSMGNIVVGSALLAGAQIQNYALMQAAVPASCYDEDVARIKQTQPYDRLIFTMWDELTPDDDPDPAVRDVAYRGRLKEVTGNLVNFHLPQDYATSFAWEINNDQAKPPNSSLAAGFQYNRHDLRGTKLYKYYMVLNLEVLDHYLTDPYEAMPYACRTWGKAVGAESRTKGSIDDSIDLSSTNYNLPGESSGFGDEHSGQFNSRFQHLRPFYDELLRTFGIERNP